MAILDVMNNHESTYHRIEAVAKTKSKVICLAISDLIKVCRNHPPTNLRLAQMIVIRLHRVTFSALHNFFGLDKELFSQVCFYCLLLSFLFYLGKEHVNTQKAGL